MFGGAEVFCPNIFSGAPDLKNSVGGKGGGGGGLMHLFLLCQKKFLYDHIPTTEDYICVIHEASVWKAKKRKEACPKIKWFCPNITCVLPPTPASYAYELCWGLEKK